MRLRTNKMPLKRLSAFSFLRLQAQEIRKKVLAEENSTNLNQALTAANSLS